MTDAPDLKVVSLHAQAMAADIVGSMRRAADSIESETDQDDRTVTGIYVTVSEGGAVKLYGWGKVGSRFEAIGILHAAMADQV